VSTNHRRTLLYIPIVVAQIATVLEGSRPTARWAACGAHLQAWRDGGLLAARERRRYRDLIKAGYGPDEWPDEAPAGFAAPSERARD
jgi:hypothetical protein